MKKLLALLAVLLIAALPVFSAEITSVTKEMSQAEYPGVLVKGSLVGTSTFVADSSILENSTIIERLNGQLWTIVSLKTDIGTIGMSISPLDTSALALNGIGVATPGNLIGLQYSGKAAGLPLGVALSYGTNRTTFNNLEIDTNSQDPDTTDTAAQYIGAKASTTLGGIDVAAGVSLSNYMETNEDWYDADNWDYWEQYDNSKLAIDVAARMPLGGGLTSYAALKWLTGKTVYAYKDDGPSDETDTWTNSKLSFEALLGKDIKAGETLTVKIASGLKASGNTSAKFKHMDFAYAHQNYFTNFNFDEDSEVIIPLNLAVEGKLNETWGFSFGANAELCSLTGNKDGENTAYWQERIKFMEEGSAIDIDPSLTWAIGVDAEIGDLKMDLYINTDIFETGPFFISGDSVSSLGAGIALIYDWK